MTPEELEETIELIFTRINYLEDKIMMIIDGVQDDPD